MSGGISKADLRRFLRWGADALGYSVLAQVHAAEPTAELEPRRPGQPPQTDEQDMGMTYEVRSMALCVAPCVRAFCTCSTYGGQELTLYGRLRKIGRCGPVSMFLRLLVEWGGTLSPAAVASKVKAFFTYYAINRHKATVLTPACHAESYSPDDNRCGC